MNLREFLDNLLVVIVLFQTKSGECIAYTSLRSALGPLSKSPEIFVYDNSPDSLFKDVGDVTYLHDPQNAGVSLAYNTAALHAGMTGKQWMLFLDQDTTVGRTFFEKLGNAVAGPTPSLVFVPRMSDGKGLVSPFYFSRARGHRLKTSPETLPLDRYRFINSGLLIRHSTFLAAGGYDEKIPLDFSDISFGQRLARVTDHLRVVDITLQHSFSDNESLSLRDALARFDYFCRGAFAMGRADGVKAVYFMRALARAFQLCIRYKSFRFLIRLFQNTRHG